MNCHNTEPTTERGIFPVMQRAMRAENPCAIRRAVLLAGRAYHGARLAAWNAQGIRHNVPMDPNVGVA